jgi:hypothetical protein
VLRRIFEPKRDEVTREWRKLRHYVVVYRDVDVLQEGKFFSVLLSYLLQYVIIIIIWMLIYHTNK